MTTWHEFGVVDLADAIADGSVSAEVVTASCLDRLQDLGPGLNAVIRIERETALESARAIDVARRDSGKVPGPLAGVPMAHKDLFYRAGRPCTGGTLIRRDFVPQQTSTVLSRLDDAGAIDLGTLHMAEFALSPTGLNVHYGHGRNPWNLDYCPGGSSSGSGAAVAARLVPASMGSDTGGSVRHPAAMCGITGLKPTQGLVSSHAVMSLAPSLDTMGPLARSARDVARLLTVIGGPDPCDRATVHGQRKDYEAGLTGDIRDLTIAVPQTYYRENTHPEVLALLDESLKVFEDLGARVIHTSVPDMAQINTMMAIMLGSEAATLHMKWLDERPQDYGDQVRSRITPGLAYSATQYVEAMMMRASICRQWLDTVMQGADVVHLPTLPIPVPTIAESESGDAETRAAVLSQVTHCNRGINYLELPSIAVPCGFTKNGLPASFQLVGRHFSEDLLLRVADAWQRVTDFHTRKPDGY